MIFLLLLTAFSRTSDNLAIVKIFEKCISLGMGRPISYLVRQQALSISSFIYGENINACTDPFIIANSLKLIIAFYNAKDTRQNMGFIWLVFFRIMTKFYAFVIQENTGQKNYILRSVRSQWRNLKILSCQYLAFSNLLKPIQDE